MGRTRAPPGCCSLVEAFAPTAEHEKRHSQSRRRATSAAKRSHLCAVIVERPTERGLSGAAVSIPGGLCALRPPSNRHHNLVADPTVGSLCLHSNTVRWQQAESRAYPVADVLCHSGFLSLLPLRHGIRVAVAVACDVKCLGLGLRLPVKLAVTPNFRFYQFNVFCTVPRLVVVSMQKLLRLPHVLGVCSPA